MAFVAFRPQRAVTVARVAPRGYVIRPGDAVASVGCDNGDDPTVSVSQVTSWTGFWIRSNSGWGTKSKSRTLRGMLRWPVNRLRAAAAADSFGRRPSNWHLQCGGAAEG